MDTQAQKELEKKALDQLLSGESLFGKDGAFAPMLKSFIEKALETERDECTT
jgi:putative transposase